MLKDAMVYLIKRVMRLPFVPFPILLKLVRLDRRFRFVIPLNRELQFNEYQGSLSVFVNTLYPIETEMLTGEYDPPTSQIIKRFITKHSVSMDVGANVGALTLLMAKIAIDGVTIAIEPGPPTFVRLRNNLQLNPAISRNVRPYQVGLGDEEGELLWAEDKNNRGNAGLLDGVGTAVRVTTLDSLFQSTGLGSLDFLKIDVEGMEYEVIKGGLRTIEEHRPIIYFETLESFRESRGFDIYAKILHYLTPLGYAFFFVGNNASLIRTSTLDILLSSNTIAIPAEKLLESERH